MMAMPWPECKTGGIFDVENSVIDVVFYLGVNKLVFMMMVTDPGSGRPVGRWEFIYGNQCWIVPYAYSPFAEKRRRKASRVYWVFLQQNNSQRYRL